MRWCFFWMFFSLLYGEQIRIGKQTLEVEIADTTEMRARGLMGREALGENRGMLFVYERAERQVFWMKDTRIPLSVGFFDEDQILIQTLDMDPPIGKTLLRYRSTAPALYALEVEQGWFEKYGIGPGEKFSFLDQDNPVESTLNTAQNLRSK